MKFYDREEEQELLIIFVKRLCKSRIAYWQLCFFCQVIPSLTYYLPGTSL